MNHLSVPMLRVRWLIALALVGLLLAAGGAALAQSGGGYDLSWNTIDGGSATFAAGGAYRLSGTVGQADAGALSGDVYTLGGGFWAVLAAGQPPMNYHTYLPLLLRR